LLNSIIKSWGSIPKIFEEMKNISSPNKTLKEFKKLITNQSKIYDLQEDDTTLSNKFKGDIFEVFVAFMLMSNTCNTKFGLSGYVIPPKSDDYGVDGCGVNVNGDITVVQCKYKTNKMDLVTYNEVSSLMVDGVCNFNLDANKDNNLFLITTGTASTCFKKFWSKNNRMVVIDTPKIEKQVDNNYNFWEWCHKYILTLQKP